MICCEKKALLQKNKSIAKNQSARSFLFFYPAFGLFLSFHRGIRRPARTNLLVTNPACADPASNQPCLRRIFSCQPCSWPTLLAPDLFMPTLLVTPPFATTLLATTPARTNLLVTNPACDQPW